MTIAEILERFPAELQPSVARLIEALREEFGVRRTDFDALRAVVHDLAEAQKDLAQAQKRTEQRVEELAEAQKRTEQRVEELAEAQKRTEQRVEELAEAQKRTEQRVEELAEAQKRTEQRVEELAEAQKRTEQRVEELAQAQRQTELRLAELAEVQKLTTEGLEQLRKTFTQQITSLQEEQERFRRTFDSRLGGLGARWGLQTEESFREGMRAILQEIGFTTERFLDIDTSGEVFGFPDQIELDVVIKNSKVIVVEIKSSLTKGDVYLFRRKVEFYERKTGRLVDRKLIVTPYADTAAKDAGVRFGVEICTDVVSLQPI